MAAILQHLAGSLIFKKHFFFITKFQKEKANANHNVYTENVATFNKIRVTIIISITKIFTILFLTNRFQGRIKHSNLGRAHPLKLKYICN